jgi:putative transposase
MLTQKAYRFRLYPNVSQKILLAKTFGCVRFYWNQQVVRFINYQKGDKFKNSTEYRNEFEWMQEVSAAAIQQKERDFEEFKRQKFNKKRKKQLGSPKFKKKNGKQSFRLPNQKFRILDNKIQLEKIGKVKIILDRELPTDVKFCNVTVSKNQAGQYFASVLVEETIQPKPKTGKAVGIDVGLKSFAVTSDGETFENPRYFRKNQAKISRIQLFQSKKQGSKKGEEKSRRWLKLQARLNRLHQKIKNQRSNFLHNLSTYLVTEYDIICTEDLNVQGMMQNHKLAKSIGDASWSMLFDQIEYKCLWYDKQHQEIDRFYPFSKTLNCCGVRLENLTLKDRTLICPKCGKGVGRDFNSSLEIKAVGVAAAQRTLRTEVTKFDEAFINLV